MLKQFRWRVPTLASINQDFCASGHTSLQHPCRSLQLSRLPLPCVQVLKMKFAAPITGADVGLKREWIIGQHLNTLGDDGDEMSGAALHTCSLRARPPCVVRLT